MSPRTRIRNPYRQLNAIRDADLFYGRIDSLEVLYEALLAGQCLAIYGSRRMGKSSLLACSGLLDIQRRVDYELVKHVLILIDLEEHLQRTPESFFAFVCTQLVEQAGKKLHVEIGEAEGSDLFSSLLQQCKAQGFHPVLFLDEFDLVVKNPQFNPDFFSFLRAQANAGKVSYVTASLTTLDKICHSEIVGSPFFNVFSHHWLGPLAHSEASELIASPAQAVGLPFSEEEIQLVLKLAGRHPFYIQRTCYFLFQMKSQGLVNIARLKREVFAELSPHFLYTWEHLSAMQQDELKREALRREAHLRSLPEYSESWLFRKYIRDITNTASHSLTMEYLRGILDKLDDFQFLGESVLSSLTLILQQEQSDSLTIAQRGLRVHKLLSDALTQLQPQTPQSAVAPEWQMYNVLQHCYFKREKRSKKQLAGYLGMSERDFYRKRDDAVRALLNVIFKMENQCVDSLEA